MTRLFDMGVGTAVLLGRADAGRLQALFERSADYFEMVEGRGPEADAALTELVDRPPGGAAEDAFCIGLEGRGELLGALHAFRGYRQRDEWYVGLLLLEPASRGAGVGEAFYLGFEGWAAGLGAKKIQLAVLECNARAARFWERIGFVLPRCYPAMEFGLRRHVVVEYEKPVALGPGAPSE